MKEQYIYAKNLIDKDLVNYLTSFSLQNAEPVVSRVGAVSMPQDEKTKAFKGDPQVPQCYAAHSKDSIIYQHLIHFLKPRIEEETGLSLKPIFCYNRIYIAGATLEKHKDRPPCEISVSLALNFSYVDKNYKWPLCIEDTPIIINTGDGVIYKGSKVNHWRPVFTQPKPSWHHQAFLHYVNKNGLYKDLKEEIGNVTNPFIPTGVDDGRNQKFN